MGDEKLSSGEVPGKFAEWLLSMGCPVAKVPSVGKISEMCRGQYYMVWRSLMEHVEPQDIIKDKRLRVFCDDVRKWQKNNVFSKQSNSIVPEQLSLWKEQVDLNEKVGSTKMRVALAEHDLNQVKDKISSKISQRNLSRQQAQDLNRRTWFLQQVAEELRINKANLEETKVIADSLCATDDDQEIQDKLDKCVAALLRQSENPIANSTVLANGDTSYEDQLTCLLRCRGDVLCSQLYERRAQLVKALAVSVDTKRRQDSVKNRVSPQSVIAHTAALHCTLSLDAAKNKIHLKQAKKRLVKAATELNNYLPSESCELLVVRCELSHYSARLLSLRVMLDELAGGGGVFAAGGGGATGARGLQTVDRAIESKRDELKHVIAALTATERKIQNVKDCLVIVFNGFHKETNEIDRFRGIQLDLPQESIATLLATFETRRETRRRRASLSLHLDVSDGSLTDVRDDINPTFVDELRLYLKKFCLEKNRQLVLDNGEKIWIFETLQSSLHRFYTQLLSEEVSCQIVCPSDSLSNNLRRLVEDVQGGRQLETVLRSLSMVEKIKDIDIKSQIKEEENLLDKMKKRLKDSLTALQKTNKNLNMGQENLTLWSDNRLRKFISSNRTVNGMDYMSYEKYYLDNFLHAL